MHLSLFEQSLILKMFVFAFEYDDTYNISVLETLVRFLSLYECVCVYRCNGVSHPHSMGVYAYNI